MSAAEKACTVESGQLLFRYSWKSQRKTVSLQIQIGMNKNKEFWGLSTLKLKRLNIAC